MSKKRVFPGLTLTCDEHKALDAIHNGAYEWKDLRRTVATRLADLGFDETVIGRVLNHAKYTVTGKHYNQHRYVDEIRAALTAWDVELQRILATRTEDPDARPADALPLVTRQRVMPTSPVRRHPCAHRTRPRRGRTPADERRAAARGGRPLPRGSSSRRHAALDRALVPTYSSPC